MQEHEHQAWPQTLQLDELGRVAGEILTYFHRVPRQAWINRDGADVGCTGSIRNLLRHTANYLVAARLAQDHGCSGPVIDVGGGVGAFGSWIAASLQRPYWLVEPDPAVRQAAAFGFPEAQLFPDVLAVPAEAGAIVLAMEVVEHVPPRDQLDFVRALHRMTAPSGLISLSTPDETGFIGGWSGYGPHVGTLDHERLSSLLLGGGLHAQLWRLQGQPFAVRRHERFTKPVVNRVWTAARWVAPTVLDAAAHHLSSTRALANGWSTGRSLEVEGEVFATAPDTGNGTGLFAAARAHSDTYRPMDSWGVPPR